MRNDALTSDTAPCRCFVHWFPDESLSEHWIGTDTTHGRYGSVDVQTCQLCGRIWLKYAVDYAAFSESDRYFRGVVTPETAASVVPETAADILSGLEWWLCGGSYYRSGPFKSSGTVDVDL